MPKFSSAAAIERRGERSRTRLGVFFRTSGVPRFTMSRNQRFGKIRRPGRDKTDRFGPPLRPPATCSANRPLSSDQLRFGAGLGGAESFSDSVRCLPGLPLLVPLPPCSGSGPGRSARWRPAPGVLRQLDQARPDQLGDVVVDVAQGHPQLELRSLGERLRPRPWPALRERICAADGCSLEPGAASPWEPPNLDGRRTT